jgi:hypothetical protein
MSGWSNIKEGSVSENLAELPPPSKEIVRQLQVCPKCGAQKGGQCIVRGQRQELNHRERGNAYKVKYRGGHGVKEAPVAKRGKSR